MLRSIFFTSIILLISTSTPAQQAGLVVHEWGTFTSLQDETGRALGGINEDVETLPSFVKDLLPGNSGKGLPVSPLVTMRLETPVVYFHLPQGSAPIKLSFSATFNGGLLTQFYPNAIASAVTGNIDPNTKGSLAWNNLTVGKPAAGPVTTSPIWLAPRNVEASDITNSEGQSERYLFYRGVGNLDAPMKVVREGQNLRLLQTETTSGGATSATLRIQTAWYFDLRDDGTCAYRKIEISGEEDLSKPLAITPADFAKTDYSKDALNALQVQMKEALIADGLFEDEAVAMLKTWENSYFKSSGSRIFFIVPRAWTDHYLPIKLSVPAEIERVMIGRIDLITPRQRQVAADLIATSKANKPLPPVERLRAQLGRFATQILTDTAKE